MAEESPVRPHQRLCFLRCLPAYRTAYVGSLAALGAFVIWVLLDRSFLSLITVSWLRDWDGLGTRRMLFAGLAIIGILSIATVFVRLLVGDRQGRSLRALILAIALVAMWMSFFVSWKKLAGQVFLWHISQMMPGIKQDALILSTSWPTGDGTLPYLGEFKSDIEHRNRILPVAFHDSPTRYRFDYAVGPYVERTKDGRIKFYADSISCWIEFRPDDSKPASFRKPIETYRTKYEHLQLERHWFLVWEDRT